MARVVIAIVIVWAPHKPGRRKRTIQATLRSSNVMTLARAVGGLGGGFAQSRDAATPKRAARRRTAQPSAAIIQNALNVT